ncbi:hypothetical protein M758_UG313700 [Ceratodon purpureus]|nr:hypothetical protein M758_UG313700 [Ceratodon purpureus]
MSFKTSQYTPSNRSLLTFDCKLQKITINMWTLVSPPSLSNYTVNILATVTINIFALPPLGSTTHNTADIKKKKKKKKKKICKKRGLVEIGRSIAGSNKTKRRGWCRSAVPEGAERGARRSGVRGKA